MRFLLGVCIVAAFLVVTGGCGDDAAAPWPSPAPAPATFKIAIEGESHSASVTVEIAATPAERQQGLMFRQQLDESAGMLFLFPTDDAIGFWMKNTYVPLTIAYIDSSGRVTELRDGKPLDETVLPPSAPYRYVLEVNQGWFKRHGLGVGARVTLPAGLPAAR
jgi:hypothetical protein